VVSDICLGTYLGEERVNDDLSQPTHAKNIKNEDGAE
jgi:hypothetical protein